MAALRPREGTAYPDLRDIKRVKLQTWGIKGVLRSNKGKSSGSAQQFKQLLKIE